MTTPTTEQLYANIADYPVRTHREENGKLWFVLIDIIKSLGVGTDVRYALNEIHHKRGEKHVQNFYCPACRQDYPWHVDQEAAQWYASQSRSKSRFEVERDLGEDIEVDIRKPWKPARTIEESPTLRMYPAEEGEQMLTIRFNENEPKRRWYVLADVLQAIGTTTSTTDARRRVEEALGPKYVRLQPIISEKHGGNLLCVNRRAVVWLAEISRGVNKHVISHRFDREPHWIDE